MKKFNNIFSTAIAVMIASSIALGPMTLRGEETETKKDIKKAVQLMEKEIEKNNKKIEKNNKENEKSKEKIKEADRTIKEADERIQLADERIKKADENIQKAEKEIDKNNKAIEEENKKLLKKCNNLKNDIVEADKYCKKNTCSKEDLKLIGESKELYKTECEKLVVPATEEKKEKK
jgi:septal ring factor EnvC (AmiA/AmiB activator)